MSLVGALAIAAPVQADPTTSRSALPVTLDCDNGLIYDTVVAGGGELTPAHDTAGTTMLVPTMFDPFSGTVTDASGTVIDQSTDPAVAKGSSTWDRTTSVTCTFSFHETVEDPDLGSLAFDGHGSVTGFTTPVR